MYPGLIWLLGYSPLHVPRAFASGTFHKKWRAFYPAAEWYARARARFDVVRSKHALQLMQAAGSTHGSLNNPQLKPHRQRLRPHRRQWRAPPKLAKSAAGGGCCRACTVTSALNFIVKSFLT